MGWNLPVGAQFADGVTLLPSQPYIHGGSSGPPRIVGTPLPTAQLQIWSSLPDGTPVRGITVQEAPGSPHLERAEQCTCQHTLEMSYVSANNYWIQMPRGTIVSDTAANIWRILSCDMTRKNATLGTLSYTMESISFDSPPDEFDIDDTSQDIFIIKHPRYAWALLPYVTDASTYALVGDTKVYYVKQKEAIVRMIQNYIESPFYPSQLQVQGRIQENILSMLGISPGQTTGRFQISYPNTDYDGSRTTVDDVPWDGKAANKPTRNCVNFALSVPVNLANPADPITIALAAAKECISKLWRQEDSLPIPCYTIKLKRFFFAPVYLNPGNYIEDPLTVVPAYFMSPSFSGSIPRGSFGAVVSPGDDTIFDNLTKINPQCFATNGKYGGPLALSSLRKADSYHYERTWFAVLSQWWVATIGAFDRDLYNQEDRPSDANGYNQLQDTFGQA